MKNELINTNNEDIEKMAQVLIQSGFLDKLKDKVSDMDDIPVEAVRQRVYDELDTDYKGCIKQTNKNCRYVLKNDPILKNAIRYNELNERIDIVSEMPWRRVGKALCDVDEANIIAYVETYYELKLDKVITRNIKTVAYDNPYNPIKEKWESLAWDGTERVRHALHHFLGADETELNYQALRLFMLGAISRVYDPGHKFDYMLCLVGGQGAGKSTFLRFLAMDDRYFTDDVKRLDGDDVFEKLQGHLIIELAEMLAAIRAANAEEIKSFITRQTDTYRIKYDKYSSEHPRKCVFAGTSNKRQFLPPDKSGNRRFIPIECNLNKAEVHILENEDESRHYIEQMWAEMMVVFKSGDFTLTLSKELQAELEALQEGFTPEDPIETQIINFLEETSEDYVCTMMLFYEGLGHASFEIPKKWESIEIGEIMDQKVNGWKKISSHKFEKYGTQRAWVRASLSPDGFRPITDNEEIPFTIKPINE
ncbi:virulence-associated E family protein [Butyrivibrio sp. INlla14]|uniref:virulence-associated E family protein n=1 Tax=Butyrivibrio sp. INlla14 TaxID=1520808 RepID=UPI00087672A4|nr:virulence-associated E family protein [Butyrivibrio sp. INlla14]SCX96592.1 Virulence-associated protein E [Butyrivibrio sp. INlla14]